jgi:hypothetical protein
MHACLVQVNLSAFVEQFPELALAVDKIETGSKYPNFEPIDKELYHALADLK